MDTVELASIAHALGDPTRVEVLRLIVAGRDEECCSPAEACCPNGVCVCDIQQGLGIGQSRVSYHIGELRAARLISETRVGRWNYYEVNDERVLAFVRAMTGIISPAAWREGAITPRPT